MPDGAEGVGELSAIRILKGLPTGAVEVEPLLRPLDVYLQTNIACANTIQSAACELPPLWSSAIRRNGERCRARDADTLAVGAPPRPAGARISSST